MIGLDFVSLNIELKYLKDALQDHENRIKLLEISYTKKCQQLNAILIIILSTAIIGLVYNIAMGFIR